MSNSFRNLGASLVINGLNYFQPINKTFFFLGSRKQENNEGISYGISVVGLERNNSRREIWEGKFQEKKECNEIEGMTKGLGKQLRIC